MRNFWFCGGVLLGLSFALVFSASADTRWTLPVEQSSTHYITRIAQDFARQVKRDSKGVLDIDVVVGESVLQQIALKSRISRGEEVLGEVLLSALGEEIPLLELDSLPFLAQNYEQAQRLWGLARADIERQLLATGVRLLYVVPWQPQSLYSRQPLTTPDDLRDLRFGVQSPLLARLADVVGAQSVSIAGTGLREVFEQDVVDVVLASSSSGVDTRVWRATNYFYDVQAFIPKNAVLINERAFRSLPEAARNALLSAGKRAEQQGWALSRALHDRQVKRLEHAGMEVFRQVPDALRIGLDGAGSTMLWEWAGKAGQSRHVLDAYLYSESR